MSEAVPTAQKRRLPSDSESSDEPEDVDESLDDGYHSREKKTGKSRSGIAAKLRQERLKHGEIVVTEKMKKKWQDKVRMDDPHATFTSDVRVAIHSKCGTVVTMKYPCDIERWRSHLKKCEAKPKLKPHAGTKTLFGMGWKILSPSKKKKKVEVVIPVVEEVHPCPGITAEIHERIPIYLERTGVSGGGARSVKVIAEELFGKLFSQLGGKKKKRVLDTQHHERTWRNDHDNVRVFAVACERQVAVQPPKDPPPCVQCLSLLKNKGFKNALRKKPSDEENYIYTNHRFRNPTLGKIYARTIGLRSLIEEPKSKASPCIRYADAVLNGKLDNKVFEGLVEATVIKYERDERGTGMQNFQYAPAYDEMCHILKMHSPKAYESMQHHFAMPSERNLRQKEARQPRFPMEICDKTFELVQDHLKTLDYTGPVGLSCDDTKLFSSLRLYWDSEKKGYFLVGGDDGPYQVPNPEAVKSVIAEGKIQNATKIRLWCLTIPAPKSTPIIIAAMPISNSLDAETLFPYLLKIIDGLIDREIRVISYACDGTEVERAIQRLFVENSKSDNIEHVIPNPREGCPDTKVTVVMYRGQAMAMIQDSKHALKTFRNNLFSGARLLTFGNYTAMYNHIRELAMENGTPLYKRDVDKLDRQDDNAASRLFSADVLQFLSDHHPSYIGEIIYLFVFGELVDAYQNRNISHDERLKLVLRARYYLDAWETFLDHSGYKKSQYFLSREAVDIARIIIEGYIALVIIHRDHVDGTYPLFPWLHSSEACEHAFGAARQIVKDFTLLDFIYMIPKLRIKMREAVLRARGSDPKARAAGYNHTYFDTSGIDIPVLMVFPTDVRINAIAELAAQECDSIIAILGLSPAQLHDLHSQPTTAEPHLPSIASWLHEIHNSEGLEDAAIDFDDEWGSDCESISEAQELQDLIDREEDKTLSRTKKQDDTILNLTCAALAVITDDAMKVRQMAEQDDEDIIEELLTEESDELRDIMTTLPAVNIADVRAKPLGQGTLTFDMLDFSSFVNMRRLHQTRQAARGVRTKQDNPDDKIQEEISIRRRLIREFHEALRSSQDDKAAGSGMERTARWHETHAPGGRDGEVDGVSAQDPASGNVANAALAATAIAKKAATRRKDIFTKAKVPYLGDVFNARVTAVKPIKLNDYGFVFTEKGVRLGKVITLYSKTGGKYGKHGSVTVSSNVSAISYVGVQVFEHAFALQFRAIPQVTPAGVEVSQEDGERFNRLHAGRNSFFDAMKMFRKRVKTTEEVQDE